MESVDIKKIENDWIKDKFLEDLIEAEENGIKFLNGYINRTIAVNKDNPDKIMGFFAALSDRHSVYYRSARGFAKIYDDGVNLLMTAIQNIGINHYLSCVDYFCQGVCDKRVFHCWDNDKPAVDWNDIYEFVRSIQFMENNPAELSEYLKSTIDNIKSDIVWLAVLQEILSNYPDDLKKKDDYFTAIVYEGVYDYLNKVIETLDHKSRFLLTCYSLEAPEWVSIV